MAPLQSWKRRAKASAAELAAAPANWRVLYGRQDRWHRGNLRTVSCKLPLKEAAAFERECEAAGVTRYEVLRYMVAAFVIDRAESGK